LQQQFQTTVREVDLVFDRQFWSGKRVLITGHTGFKGAWAWAWLEHLGAEVSGFSLAPDTDPNLSEILGQTKQSKSFAGDILDKATVSRVVKETKPEYVLHMAAQALVRRSYREPVKTFDVNVTGTLNVLNALREAKDLKACIVVTSDKVYENNDLGRRFVEEDRLGGSDPYSASKAACEIATASFARSYFEGKQPGASSAFVATARSGNVIGGGDWSEDRIVPDVWRARRNGTQVELRYPRATRPWQHVLEPVLGYLMYLKALGDGAPDRALNFGPSDETEVTVSALVESFQSAYGTSSMAGWKQAPGKHPKEAALLAIDASRAVAKLGWTPRLTPHEAINWTAQWYAAYDRGEDMVAYTLKQIQTYETL
jgi:CDP-glucose 4,6-dehydratase